MWLLGDWNASANQSSGDQVRLLEPFCRRSHGVHEHLPKNRNDMYVAHKESSQAADLLRLSLPCRQSQTS